jgi:hypothetical protein
VIKQNERMEKVENEVENLKNEMGQMKDLIIDSFAKVQETLDRMSASNHESSSIKRSSMEELNSGKIEGKSLSSTKPNFKSFTDFERIVLNREVLSNKFSEDFQKIRQLIKYKFC